MTRASSWTQGLVGQDQVLLEGVVLDLGRPRAGVLEKTRAARSSSDRAEAAPSTAALHLTVAAAPHRRARRYLAPGRQPRASTPGWALFGVGARGASRRRRAVDIAAICRRPWRSHDVSSPADRGTTVGAAGRRLASTDSRAGGVRGVVGGDRAGWPAAKHKRVAGSAAVDGDLDGVDATPPARPRRARGGEARRPAPTSDTPGTGRPGEDRARSSARAVEVRGAMPSVTWRRRRRRTRGAAPAEPRREAGALPVGAEVGSARGRIDALDHGPRARAQRWTTSFALGLDNAGAHFSSSRACRAAPMRAAARALRRHGDGSCPRADQLQTAAWASRPSLPTRRLARGPPRWDPVVRAA